jgi:hypothetical protein
MGRSDMTASTSTSTCTNTSKSTRSKRVLGVCSGRRRGNLLPRLLCALILYGIGSLWYWNQQAIWEEREAPLDHIAAALQTPLYALTCPVIPEDPFVDVQAAVAVANANANTNTNRTLSIPFAMISARPTAQVQPVFQSWSKCIPSIQLVSTLHISRTYQNTRCHIQRHSWASRLFAVYQDVFRRLLQEYPDQQHFVTIEDDTVLLNATRLYQELHWAVTHNVGYYSFTSTSLASSDSDSDVTSSSSSSSPSPSCIYEYGATAQLISRRLMQSVVAADDDSFCRLPIDMFIARAGPWYVTTERITKHIGKRLKIQQSSSPNPRRGNLS